MPTRSYLKSTLLIVAGAIGLTLAAASANAQEYGAYQPTYSNGDEEVQVIVPRPHAARGPDGGPIEDVAMSRPVRFDDLDLRSDWGARRLRDRIEFTARTLCQQLDTMYPISVDSTDQSCYRRTVDDAMYQADMAIRNARYNP